MDIILKKIQIYRNWDKTGDFKVYIKNCHGLDPYRQYLFPSAFSTSCEGRFEITGQQEECNQLPGILSAPASDSCPPLLPLSGFPVNWNCSHVPNMLGAIISYLRAFAHTLSPAEISLTILANRKIFCILFGDGFRSHLLREIFLVFFSPFGSKLDLSSAPCDSLYRRMFQMVNLLISVCLLHDMEALWAKNYFLGT